MLVLDTDAARVVRAALIALLLIIAGCDSGNGLSLDIPGAKPQPDNPTVEGPVTGGGGEDCCKVVIGALEIDLTELLNYTPGTPFYAGLYFDKAEVGYRETEYFISGTASSYIPTNTFGEDGMWSVQKSDSAPYKSRIVVLRPENAADFNGTVVVEWLNVSGGTDAAPELVQTHTELMRKGYAWIGVSAQKVGVEGGGGLGGFDVSLKTIDPTRYASLNHPGDSFSYDIFSQAAQAVRHPQGIDPLEGLQVQYMIGVGESQSAFRMATYVNAIHPTVEAFDGFMIHSRGGSSAALTQDTQKGIPSQPTFIRADIPEPVLGVETETDIFGLSETAAIPQPDADNFRLWEVAGNAHYDAYGVVKGPVDRGGDPGVAEVIEVKNGDSAGVISCALPINDGPAHWVLKAGIAALDHWIRTGEPAASAEPMVRNAEGTDLQRDRYSNALGGIRTPYVDAPVATFSGFGQAGGSFCFLFGTTKKFDDGLLIMIYQNQQGYIDAIDKATDSAVDKGFILPEDGELIKAQARNTQ